MSTWSETPALWEALVWLDDHHDLPPGMEPASKLGLVSQPNRLLIAGRPYERKIDATSLDSTSGISIIYRSSVASSVAKCSVSVLAAR